MKRMNKMLLVAALAATTLSVQAEQKKGPAWLSDALFYQIYPSSYMDTDGNGIGDLPGITSKLDYIKSLGVNALWLNPIFESGWFDGGYDVIDFYKVDPRFGTNTDLVTLVNEAHKRGIKVCLDLVAGHSSTKCAWFKESSEKDPNQRYSDYYIWMNDIPESEKKEIEARHQVGIKYREALRNVEGITFFDDIPGVKHNYSYFPIFVDAEKYGMTRDELYFKMKEQNVLGRRYFYPLISTFSTYRGLESANPENLPEAHKMADSVICLPMHHALSVEDIERVLTYIIK